MERSYLKFEIYFKRRACQSNYTLRRVKIQKIGMDVSVLLLFLDHVHWFNFYHCNNEYSIVTRNSNLKGQTTEKKRSKCTNEPNLKQHVMLYAFRNIKHKQ